MFTFFGPGLLIAVGYMDPGNWMTDIAAGAAFNYSLLFVVFSSSIVAMFLQGLALRLGMVTRKDIAQHCRDHYSKGVVNFLWVTAEIAIIACDLAEVIGSAVALKLLFGIPLVWGVVITSLDVVVLLVLSGRSMRWIEAIILALMSTIIVCFAIELWFARPDPVAIIEGTLWPTLELVTNSSMLYLSVGIMGATIMPHNLYLHSSIVQSRDTPLHAAGMRESLMFGMLDSTISLVMAFVVNAAILILAAATFNRSGHPEVASLDVAYEMLSDVLGTRAASVLFGVALLASGQQSTLTGTMAGQIVMEGFVKWSCRPEIRRLVTRLAAVCPAAVMVLVCGDGAVNSLLVLSQVVLSFQLPFVIYPLVRFTSSRTLMGEFANDYHVMVLAYLVAGLVTLLNVILLAQTFMSP